ncbi:ABC transporter permease [Jhaorihella thermophila]
MPPVFLAVAAFLLHIVISRMVQAEREQIGLLKAFGYTDWEVGGHYFRMILTIATGGALAGCVLGIVAGRAMVDLYLYFYKFPFLVFRLDPSSFLTGFVVSILSASAGGALVLRRVFALTPAVAMRPPAPPDYSRSGRFRGLAARFLDQPTRMVLRRLTRQPLRMAGAVVGIASGIALSAAMASILDSFDEMMDLTFGVMDRSDMSVTFTQPIEARSVLDLAAIDGVIEVEPVRMVPAILRHGRDSYRGAIHGLRAEPRLYRAVDKAQRPLYLRGDGITLSRGLANELGVRAGQVLTLEVREGRRPRVDIPVIAVAETLLGSPAYMELDALNRALKEPLRVSGAYLRVDPARADRIHARLKDMPMVAGVSLKAQARASLARVMDQGAGGTRYVMALIAAVITFGVIYNAARVAQAERARDLASLRVLGFTRAEVAYVLLGELAVVTLLALPLGGLMGWGLSFVISRGYSTDIYQIPPLFSAESYGWAMLVVLLAALVSGGAGETRHRPGGSGRRPEKRGSRTHGAQTQTVPSDPDRHGRFDRRRRAGGRLLAAGDAGRYRHGHARTDDRDGGRRGAHPRAGSLCDLIAHRRRPAAGRTGTGGPGQGRRRGRPHGSGRPGGTGHPHP